MFIVKNTLLSNMHPTGFELDGYSWSCVEQYFQAQKATSEADKNRFMGLDGYASRKLGKRLLTIAPNWDTLRLQVMKRALVAKFTQNDNAKRFLLEKTGNLPIVELNTWGDTFWGVCERNGKLVGSNHLGTMLMDLRKQLKDGVLTPN